MQNRERERVHFVLVRVRIWPLRRCTCRSLPRRPRLAAPLRPQSAANPRRLCCQWPAVASERTVRRGRQGGGAAPLRTCSSVRAPGMGTVPLQMHLVEMVDAEETGLRDKCHCHGDTLGSDRCVDRGVASAYQLTATCARVLPRAVATPRMASTRARVCAPWISPLCLPVNLPLASGAHASTVTPSSLQAASRPAPGRCGCTEVQRVACDDTREAVDDAGARRRTRLGVSGGRARPAPLQGAHAPLQPRPARSRPRGPLDSGARRSSENSISLNASGTPRSAIRRWKERSSFSP